MMCLIAATMVHVERICRSLRRAIGARVAMGRDNEILYIPGDDEEDDDDDF